MRGNDCYDHANNAVSPLPSIHAITNRDEIRKDQRNHLITETDKKCVCKFCSNRTSYRCRGCDVGLHSDCFELIFAEACHQIVNVFVLLEFSFLRCLV